MLPACLRSLLSKAPRLHSEAQRSRANTHVPPTHSGDVHRLPNTYTLLSSSSSEQAGRVWNRTQLLHKYPSFIYPKTRSERERSAEELRVCARVRFRGFRSQPSGARPFGCKLGRTSPSLRWVHRGIQTWTCFRLRPQTCSLPW